MVALSVSTSASTSPTATLSPTLLIHLTSVPSVMVSLSFGISMAIGIEKQVSRSRGLSRRHARHPEAVSSPEADCRLPVHPRPSRDPPERPVRRKPFPAELRQFARPHRRMVCFLPQSPRDGSSGLSPRSLLRRADESNGGPQPPRLFHVRLRGSRRPSGKSARPAY